MIRDNPGTSATTPITKVVRQTLRAEIKRTGITAIMLLNEAHDIPDGLNAAHINRWMGGVITSAPARHVGYVIDRWAGLPDNAGSVSADGGQRPKRGKRFADDDARMAVTEAMSKELRAELARTGLDHATLTQRFDNPPSGLTARIIRGWLYRDSATTNETYWNFVMAWLMATPDLSGLLPVPVRRSRRKPPDGMR